MADDKKRAKITEENRLEAASLLALWNASKGAHRTQAEFGEHYGLGNQANVGHYLHARSALNPKAAAAFALELKCKVEDFSPRVAEEIRRQGLEYVPGYSAKEDRALHQDAPAPALPQIINPTMGSGGFLLEAIAAIGRAILSAPTESRRGAVRMLEEYFADPAANEDMLKLIERRLLGESLEPRRQINGK